MSSRALLFLFLVGIISGCTSEMDKDLVSAAGTGNAAKVIFLIDRGANIEAHAIDGWTPLTAAANGGHLNVVKILLENKVDIDASEEGGNTAIFWAAFYGHTEVVRLLIKHGADVNKKAKRGELPLDAANERKNDQIAILLQEATAHTSHK